MLKIEFKPSLVRIIVSRTPTDVRTIEVLLSQFVTKVILRSSVVIALLILLLISSV